MSGEETFEFAAAIAGVCIGLAAVLVLAVLAVVGVWQLFRRSNEASLAVTRAALSIEDLARRLAVGEQGGEGGQLAGLRRQAEALAEQQRRLQDMARNLLDTAALGAGPAPAALDEVETAVGRLDATVGQMAASLANLIQLLERQQRT